MNFKKITYKTNWILWVILAIIAECVATGGLLYLGYLLKNHTIISEIFYNIGWLLLGWPFLMLFEEKSEVEKEFKKKEKKFKLKNLFFMSKKDLKNPVEYHKLEKEL